MLFRTELNCNYRMHTRVCVLGRNQHPARYIRNVENFGNARVRMRSRATHPSGADNISLSLVLPRILRRKNQTTAWPQKGGRSHS
jgi:hypothetical protein